ncbi:hypothetical protein GCM10023195_76760 [Actinoallomurus liliacearum]|uniref:Transcriptional regulator n=1 Tax=Actinoallomurus liliacearum TaxID=1080073 RepID=A0ABP8TXG5_9ACTN
MIRMISIEIDEDLVGYLQQQAKPREDTAQTLRRLLGIDIRVPRALPPGWVPPVDGQDSRRAAILAVLRAHPGATTLELIRGAGVAYATGTKILRSLQQEGVAIRWKDPWSSGPGVLWRWRLTGGDNESDPDGGTTATTRPNSSD